MIRGFIKKLAKELNISSSGVHASVRTFYTSWGVTYGNLIKFSEQTTVDNFTAKVDGLDIGKGSACINHGFKFALNEMFNETNGMRIDSPKILIFISDGFARDANLPVTTDYGVWKRKFIGRKITVHVIATVKCKNNNCNTNEDMQNLVENPNNYHKINDFDILIDKKFIEQIKLRGMTIK